MNKIVNLHVIDPKNIGDRLSSPLQYFNFPGFDTQALDIRTISPEAFESSPLQNSSIIIGGGVYSINVFKAILKILIIINNLENLEN
jgi:hypothetical protein